VAHSTDIRTSRSLSFFDLVSVISLFVTFLILRTHTLAVEPRVFPSKDGLRCA
jgi:hypothetical protein